MYRSTRKYTEKITIIYQGSSDGEGFNGTVKLYGGATYTDVHLFLATAQVCEDKKASSPWNVEQEFGTDRDYGERRGAAENTEVSAQPLQVAAARFIACFIVKCNAQPERYPSTVKNNRLVSHEH